MKIRVTNIRSAIFLIGMVAALLAHSKDISATGSITCSPTLGGAPRYTQSLNLIFNGKYATGNSESANTKEFQELAIENDGVVRYSAAGYGLSDNRFWIIRASGKKDKDAIVATGKMINQNREIIRQDCNIKLDASDLILPSVTKNESINIEQFGSVSDISPSTFVVGRGFFEWNFERGMPWSYHGTPSENPSALSTRNPSLIESFVVKSLKKLLETTNAKAFILVDNGKVVSAVARPGISEGTLLPSASMSKNITALGVGKAICTGALSLDTSAYEFLPELIGTATGSAKLREILLMSSGSSETEFVHTHGITSIETEKYLRSKDGSLRALLATKRLTNLKRSGKNFDYKSYDPYLAAFMVQNSTGKPFTSWLKENVFDEAGLLNEYFLDTDTKGNFLATGGVRLSLSDWIRLAIYIQKQRDASTCFGNFVREMFKSQITIKKQEGINGYFNGYGYFTWVENDMAPHTAWIAGHFGQRIGLSNKKDNNKIFITFGDGSDPDMKLIYPIANRWIN